MNQQWQCSRCEAKFAKQTILRAHEWTLHRIEPKQSVAKRKLSTMDDSDGYGPQQQQQQQKKPAAANEHVVTLPAGILIPKITTTVMDTVRQNRQIPFAVLHFLKSVPLIVRIHDYENDTAKHLLCAASNGDFEAVRQQRKNVGIPIVASIHQWQTADGRFEFNVEAPQNIYNMSNEGQIKLQFQDSDAEGTAHMMRELKRMETMQQKQMAARRPRLMKVEPEDTGVAAERKLSDAKRSPTVIGRAIELSELGAAIEDDTYLKHVFENITCGTLLSPQKCAEVIRDLYFRQNILNYKCNCEICMAATRC